MQEQRRSIFEYATDVLHKHMHTLEYGNIRKPHRSVKTKQQTEKFVVSKDFGRRYLTPVFVLVHFSKQTAR